MKILVIDQREGPVAVTSVVDVIISIEQDGIYAMRKSENDSVEIVKGVGEPEKSAQLAKDHREARLAQSEHANPSSTINERLRKSLGSEAKEVSE